MRILITGSSGFIGKSLLKIFEKGNHNILCINRVKQNYKSKNITQIISPIEKINLKYKKINKFKPQIVINLAWHGIPNYGFKNSIKNLDNSIKFFNTICKIDSVKKIVNTGSCWEAGIKNGSLKSNIWNPDNYFTWAKYSLFKWLNLLSKSKKIDIVWLRLFYIYGPNQNNHSLIPTLYHSLKKENPKLNINTPFDSVDFLHVDDCAKAIAKSCNKKIKTNNFNIGSGKSTYIYKICKLVEKNILNSTHKTEEVMKITKNKIKTNFYANISKTKSQLNWKPKINIIDGINKTISSMNSK